MKLHHLLREQINHQFEYFVNFESKDGEVTFYSSHGYSWISFEVISNSLNVVIFLEAINFHFCFLDFRSNHFFHSLSYGFMRIWVCQYCT